MTKSLKNSKKHKKNNYDLSCCPRDGNMATILPAAMVKNMINEIEGYYYELENGFTVPYCIPFD